MNPIVSIQNTYKNFGAVEAVRDVSFDVYPGEIFGMLGPNGAGKTTTIRILLDIFKADGGTVSVLGGELTEAKKNRIGYLPEERGLYKDQKLEPVLVYLATLKGVDEKTARSRLRTWLERFDLYDHRQKKVKELSRGMQQKAQFIVTLLHEPDLIIVDEPFSGLDPVNTRLVKQVLQEQRDAGKTIIMSTHQMHQVEALCSRIVLINEGYSVLYGEVDQIKQDFAGHEVMIYGNGDFTGIPGVQEVRPDNGGWRLTLEADTTPKNILQNLSIRDDLTIKRFEIAEPSLDDIFVAIVKGER
ncbi:MAG TPA: ATP-binding cassette domain-containing protein [Anaerolineales bacterium]|nr:ATP-binding cassette domain-containing protein [Anaerolineales bacterium]